MARRLRHLAAERHRVDAARARSDTRDRARERRERTRHLIELGGLVQKAGLIELVDDDRATLLGAFLELADRLGEGRDEKDASGAGFTPAQLAAAWRHRGLRAFDRDGGDAAPGDASRPPP